MERISQGQQRDVSGFLFLFSASLLLLPNEAGNRGSIGNENDSIGFGESEDWFPPNGTSWGIKKGTQVA